jgi:6-phosphogluconate dehydrogenase
MQADIGLVGLAVMGQNLVLNMESKGYTVAVYNRTSERTRQFMAERAKGKKIVAAFGIKELVEKLKKPRRIMIMVKAGPAVDDMIGQLAAHLQAGDVLVDGGNSFFQDTIRRSRELESRGLAFIGAGVSGGEEGALHGPSIMPGGTRDAYRQVGTVLVDISAKVGSQPCCTYIGTDGSGHYVKMVHNGIEYGDMQLIGEAYVLLKDVLALSYGEIQRTFASWNRGELDSYLMGITADILSKSDPDTGKPLVEVILDKAQQKGTGKWASQSALDLGVSAPTIAEAVFARCISALKEERLKASSLLPGPEASFEGDELEFVESIRQALYAAKICSYAQGFALLQAAAGEYGWELAPAEIATIWRGGCIIRARFLDKIREAYQREPRLGNLLMDPYFAAIVRDSQLRWREVVSTAARLGVPVPAFSSALGYYDAFRSPRLWANLIQAQRDYFGAHTYQRVDREGTFHTEWTKI